jgi:hypothetical protein
LDPSSQPTHGSSYDPTRDPSSENLWYRLLYAGNRAEEVEYLHPKVEASFLGWMRMGGGSRERYGGPRKELEEMGRLEQMEVRYGGFFDVRIFFHGHLPLTLSSHPIVFPLLIVVLCSPTLAVFLSPHMSYLPASVTY